MFFIFFEFAGRFPVHNFTILAIFKGSKSTELIIVRHYNKKFIVRTMRNFYVQYNFLLCVQHAICRFVHYTYNKRFCRYHSIYYFFIARTTNRFCRQQCSSYSLSLLVGSQSIISQFQLYLRGATLQIFFIVRTICFYCTYNRKFYMQ